MRASFGLQGVVWAAYFSRDSALGRVLLPQYSSWAEAGGMAKEPKLEAYGMFLGDPRMSMLERVLKVRTGSSLRDPPAERPWDT